MFGNAGIQTRVTVSNQTETYSESLLLEFVHHRKLLESCTNSFSEVNIGSLFGIHQKWVICNNLEGIVID